MKLDKIKEIIEKEEMAPIGVKNKYAVFIPFIKIEEKPYIIYEKRAMTLRNQPGEISFPGGKIEEGENFVQAAIRETCEELLIEEKDIEVYGKGDFLVNPYSAVIYSVVGEIKKPFSEINPSEDEVDSIFAVPLDYFLEQEPDIYEMKLNVTKNDKFPYELIPHGKNYKFKRGTDNVCFYNYEDNIIWGFTAKMTYELIKKIKSKNKKLQKS